MNRFVTIEVYRSVEQALSKVEDDIALHVNILEKVEKYTNDNQNDWRYAAINKLTERYNSLIDKLNTLRIMD